jgi:hypothetical protein
MFFSKKKSDGKQELLDRARRERDLRAASQLHGAFSIRLQAVCRGFLCRQRNATVNATDLSAKLQQVALITAALKSSKGIDFIPPTQVLSLLVTHACFILRSMTPEKHLASLRQLVAWLQLHLRRAEASTNLPSSRIGVMQMSRFLVALCRKMLSRTDPAISEPQLQLLDFIMFCVGPACSDKPELRAAVEYWQRALRGAGFAYTVCRSLCLPPSAVDSERTFCPSDSHKRVCARAVEIALVLADSSGAAAAVSHAYSYLLTQVLSTPYLLTSIAGSAAHMQLTESHVLHALIAGYSSTSGTSLAIADPPQAPPRKFKPKVPMESLVVVSSGLGPRGGGSASSTSVSALPAPASTGGPSSLWAGGAFLLGNIIQLLCDAPPSCLSPSSRSIAASGAAAVALEALEPSFRAAWLNLIWRLISTALPEGALAVATPVLWVRRYVRSGTTVCRTPLLLCFVATVVQWLDFDADPHAFTAPPAAATLVQRHPRTLPRSLVLTHARCSPAQ